VEDRLEEPKWTFICTQWRKNVTVLVFTIGDTHRTLNVEWLSRGRIKVES